jgi:hypothetical protein
MPNYTNTPQGPVVLGVPKPDALPGIPIETGFDARWGAPGKPPKPEFGITRTDLPAKAPPAGPPPLPVWQDDTPDYGSGNTLSAGEAERALADLRSRGMSEDKIKAAMGDDYAAQPGQSSTSGPHDFGRIEGPLAAVREGLTAGFHVAAIPRDVAASVAGSLVSSMREWAALPANAKPLYERTEEYYAEQVLPGAVAKAKAVVAKMFAVSPELRQMEANGLLKSRRAIVHLAQFGQV